jgi:hypothetical protein
MSERVNKYNTYTVSFVLQLGATGKSIPIL